jgi:salicylate hydroxylase
MGQGDCWALFRSLEQSYLPDYNGVNKSRIANSSQHYYNLRRALQLYNETRRHFLGRVELQMTLDVKEGAYLAEAGSDEEEWMRRFRERYKSQAWMKEHDVEAEFVKTLAAEPLWSRDVEAIKIESASL